MICPKCKCVYQEGVTECSDCHVPLVEMLQDGEPQIYAMRPVKLIGVQSQLDSDLLMEMLKAENIPSIRKLVGSGSYLNITMGFSAFGADIYVDEDDYERARELLEVWKAPSGLDEDCLEEETAALSMQGKLPGMSEPADGDELRDTNTLTNADAPSDTCDLTGTDDLTDIGEHSYAAPNEEDELLSKQADPRYRLAILIVRIFLVLMLIGTGVVLLTGLSSLFQLF